MTRPEIRLSYVFTWRRKFSRDLTYPLKSATDDKRIKPGKHNKGRDPVVLIVWI